MNSFSKLVLALILGILVLFSGCIAQQSDEEKMLSSEESEKILDNIIFTPNYINFGTLYLFDIIDKDFNLTNKSPYILQITFKSISYKSSGITLLPAYAHSWAPSVYLSVRVQPNQTRELAFYADSSVTISDLPKDFNGSIPFEVNILSDLNKTIGSTRGEIPFYLKLDQRASEEDQEIQSDINSLENLEN